MNEKIQRLADKLLAERAMLAERPRAKYERWLPDFDPFQITRWKVVAGGDPGYLPQTPMRMGKIGFHVACQSCGGEFESKGMAYCLGCLELPADDRRAMRPAAIGRLCQAPNCEKFVPRKARADVMYCSRACRQRAHRARRVTATAANHVDIAPPKNVTDNDKKE